MTTTNLQNSIPNPSNHIHPSTNIHAHNRNGISSSSSSSTAISTTATISTLSSNPSVSSSILHPVPMTLTTYKSPLRGLKNRKRARAISDNISSPNINSALARKRRRLSPNTTQTHALTSCLPSLMSLSPQTTKPKKPQPLQKSVSPAARSKQTKKPQPQKQKSTKRNTAKNNKNTSNTKSKSKKKQMAVEDWSETDQDYSDDDDYVPPKTTKNNIVNGTNNKPESSHSDSNESNTDTIKQPSGYRKLNWRKKQVATPKFIMIDADHDGLSVNQPTITRHQSMPIQNIHHVGSKPPSLIASASTMDMYGIEGDKLEDTSNTAYFYRHYRAEAREKKFYEELFESRIKHQQILEEKERRKKKLKQKKSKSKRKSKLKTKSDHLLSENENGAKPNDDNNNNAADTDEDDIDLTLPTLPKGPWSFKLGPEYDQRPQVPSIVTNRPQFNYHIPFEQLQRKQFITDIKEKKKMDNWWKMPPHLIRRTDYGNYSAQIKVATKAVSRSNSNTNIKNIKNVKHNNMDKTIEEKKKQELIDLYVQLKQHQKAKKSGNKKADKKKHKKKHKHKKKSKHKDKNKSKHKTVRPITGPIDVRLLLKK